MKAHEIMTKEVVTADENATVREAVDLMAGHGIGAIVVQTPRPTFGIFTQGDLINRVLAKKKSLNKTKVRDVMTEDAKCAQAEDNVDEIVDIMYGENVKYLPVMDGRKLIGIISTKDLFRYAFRASEGYKEEVV